MAGLFNISTWKVGPYGPELQSDLTGNVSSGLMNHVNQVLLLNHVGSALFVRAMQWVVSLLNSVQRNWCFFYHN